MNLDTEYNFVILNKYFLFVCLKMIGSCILQKLMPGAKNRCDAVV